MDLNLLNKKKTRWKMFSLFIAYFEANGVEGDKNVITRFSEDSI